MLTRAAAQPETRPLCQKQAADLAAQIESSQSDVLQLEDMAGLFIMEGAALALAWAIRGRRSSVKHVVKVRESLRSRLRSAVKTGKMSTKRIKEAMAMGGEMRPDWEDAEGGGDDDDSDDFDIDSHAPEDNIGGMEGRLTSLVLEHTAVMGAFPLWISRHACAPCAACALRADQRDVHSATRQRPRWRFSRRVLTPRWKRIQSSSTS